MTEARHHPPAPSSKEEWEKDERSAKAPSSSEGDQSHAPLIPVGGGGPTRQLLLKRAAEMRRNPTEPERRLWMELRDSRFFGFKFRRQVVMGWRIVDFFCPAKGLAIEIDGDTHEAERDLARDARVKCDFGFEVVRFTNLDVMQNLDGVLIALKIALERRPERWLKRREHHPPTPSSEEEWEKKEHRFKAPSSSEEGVGGGGGPR